MESKAPTVESETPVLLPQHEKLIRESAISPEVARARGYRSVTKKAELESLGFSRKQCLVPALLIPIWDVRGEPATYQARPDSPRVRKGKVVKYETPEGSHMVLDVSPLARPWLGDPSRLLLITEGIRKADSAVSLGLCCIGLLGVWNWRGSNWLGGKTALPDWENIALNARDAYLAFDSDTIQKEQVWEALSRLRGFLRQRKAEVRVINLPPGEGGSKTGLDDFIAAGHSVSDLLALATDDWRRPVPEQGAAAGGEAQSQVKRVAGSPYLMGPGRTVWQKPVMIDGEQAFEYVTLANFSAEITSELILDDGAEELRWLEITGCVDEASPRTFAIPSGNFVFMQWPIEHLGARACIAAGQALRDRLREAIQHLSTEVSERRVYCHLGWRRVGEIWCYLHAGGALGPRGPIETVEVRLCDELSRFELPDPPLGEDLSASIHASLRFLDTAPDNITVPIYSAIWRGALGSADCSLHECGPTGEGKTELLALAQQHWGPGMDSRHLPGSWSSTGNATEGLAFLAKDALLAVDDFAPSGSMSDVARMHRDADRVFRAQGNRSGRQRMRPDGTLRPRKPPRGLIVSTGEDLPRGHSLRARVLVIEVSPGAVDWEKLSACQDDAAIGLYAQALAGFVHWLAPQYESVRSRMRAAQPGLRDALRKGPQHRRTTDMAANLALGLSCFLAYARDAGALTIEESTALWERSMCALSAVAEAQSAHQAAMDPARRFIELLRAAIASGHAHVAGPLGDRPDAPRVWGWRAVSVGTGQFERTDWQPQGRRVGWVEDGALYLEPEASYAVVQEIGRGGGDALAIGSRTLHKRLSDQGLLLSIESNRKTLTVRRVLEGSRRNVLHMNPASLMPKATDQTAHGAWTTGGNGQKRGQFDGQIPASEEQETDHGNCPDEAWDPDEGALVGSLGSFSTGEE
jgi:hypothetical protein